MQAIPNFPRMLAVDFDGTIVQSQYPDIGELRLNVVKNMKKLHDEGFYIIIWTCRCNENEEKSLLAAEEFLRANDIPFDALNEHHPFTRQFYNNDTRKISADIYIDDKQLGGLPEDWDVIYLLIHRHFEQLKAK